MKKEQDSWEIEFDKQFLTPEGFWNRDNNMYPFKVKSFIRSTLNSTLQRIQEKVGEDEKIIHPESIETYGENIMKVIRNSERIRIRQVINEEMI